MVIMLNLICSLLICPMENNTPTNIYQDRDSIIGPGNAANAPVDRPNRQEGTQTIHPDPHKLSRN